MAEYFQLLDTKGLPINVVQTVGHTQVRRIVLGDVERRPSDEELDRMREMVREAMEAGAIGVSTALTQLPSSHELVDCAILQAAKVDETVRSLAMRKRQSSSTADFMNAA